jgi:hypothetical protein
VRGRLVVREPASLAACPNTVRAPDIAFATTGPAKPSPKLPTGSRPARVWVIDPERRIARVYRQKGTELTIGEAESLQGEHVLPGFSCTLASILG